MRWDGASQLDLKRRSITVRSFIRWFLALLQIYCGYRALDLCREPLTDPSPTTVLIAGLALLPTAAGIALLLHLPTGRILTLIAQGVQLIGVSTPTFTWMMRFGFSSRISAHAIPSDVPGESILKTSIHVDLAEEAAFAVGHPHPDVEGYLLSINVLAFVIAVTAWFLFRKKKAASTELPAEVPAG